ncbi:carboxylesterase/lipase family protein [Spirillospora sp. CA-294931]|uniref:carboxylesterase/lipase family protein n=1 Tax=Spirillospora sp. CA-294931 TaxID=3240042 RepID=UPI003D910F61
MSTNGKAARIAVVGAIIAAGSGVLTGGAAQASTDGSVVSTDKGRVRGTVAKDHRVFQGIPYAAPPVGALRWRAPQAAAPWTTTLDATKPGKACPQPEGTPMSTPSTSEDCLRLNVTTPANPTGGKLPVMVWIHGGDFAFDSAINYGARALAARGGVVVVSIDYRLSAFGFLAHRSLPDAGNLGIEDQQAALRWVRTNIGAFGGDSRNVTLFGESAGGHSICGHLISPGSGGLFHRAIMQSSPCENAEHRTRESAEKYGAELASKLGCGDAACLRRQKVADLLKAAGTVPGNPGFGRLGPLFGDRVLPLHPKEALASGRFNRVPVLFGTTRDEERLRVWGIELGGKKPLTRRAYRAHIKEAYGKNAPAVLARYRGYDSPSLALGAVLTDHEWSRAAVDTGRAFGKWVPTYSYEFAENTVPWFKNLKRPSFPMGAFHTGELAYLLEPAFSESLDPAQRRLSHRMIGYWTSFARTGDPNSGGAPAWKPWPSVQALASGPHGIKPTDFAKAHKYEFWKRLSH